MDELRYIPPFIEGRRKKSATKGIIIIIFILILMLIPLTLGGIYLMNTFSRPTAAPTPLPTSIAFPTDTPTPIASPTATMTPTPTPKGQTLDISSGLDRAKLTVIVENGSGRVGAANKAAFILKTAGYTVRDTRNADAFDYQDVTISVKADKAPYLSLLKKDLSSEYTVTDTRATLDPSSESDALVIIGR
jgi:hypothetical protein